MHQKRGTGLDDRKHLPHFRMVEATLKSRIVPLSRRPGDIALVAFFIVNLLFISYIVDLEQLVIPDPAHFTYPVWPPPAAVDLIHWYGHTFDPVLIARPAWWKVTTGIDAVLFGPFYLVAIYAFIKGKQWIRIPSLIYASMLLTNVLIILGEEIYGEHATPQLPIVLMLNLPWLLFPIYILYRMWRYPQPFEAAEKGRDVAKEQPVGGEQATVTAR